MPSFLENQISPEIRKLWNDCMEVLGVILCFVSFLEGTRASEQGRPGIFLILNYLAGTLGIMWLSPNAVKYISSKLKKCTISRDTCSMLFGHLLLIYSDKARADRYLEKGAPDVFFLFNLLTEVVGLTWFLPKVLEYISSKLGKRITSRSAYRTIFGVIVVNASLSLAEQCSRKGASGVFMLLNFLTAAIAFTWVLPQALEYISSKLKKCTISRETCSMLFGYLLLNAGFQRATQYSEKGASSVFILSNFLAGAIGLMCFFQKLLERFSPKWKLCKVWRDHMETLGTAMLIAGFVLGIRGWKEHGYGIFIILNYLAGTVAFIWLSPRSLQICSVWFKEKITSAFEKVGLNSIVNVLKNNDEPTSRVGDEDSISPQDVKLTNSEIYSNSQLRNKSRATDISEGVKSEGANPLRCVSCKEIQICNCNVSGPVPGGRHVQKTEKC